jgi:hypothetical protein
MLTIKHLTQPLITRLNTLKTELKILDKDLKGKLDKLELQEGPLSKKQEKSLISVIFFNI